MEYPISLDGLTSNLDAITNVAITTEMNEFDTQTTTDKFARLKTTSNKIVEQINNNQAVNKQAIIDLRDNLVSIGNDLASKIDAFSEASGLDIDKVKAFVDLLKSINTDTIDDLIRGQSSIMTVVNGMSDTAILNTTVNSSDDGTIVISLASFGFGESDKYTVVVTGNNANAHIYQDTATSDHTQCVLKIRDLRYDYVKGFNTTVEAIKLNIALTHNKKTQLSNSVTKVGNLDNEDTSDDTTEVVFPN